MKKALLKLVVVSFIFVIFSMATVFANSNFSIQLQQKLKNSVVLYIGQSKAYVNNEQTFVDSTNSSVYPFIKDGRTLVPVRFISEKLGGAVGWYEPERAVIIHLKNGSTVKMIIGSKTIYIDGAEKEIDVPAQIVNERTFIPLRALVEILGKQLFWDDRGLIVISDNALDANTDNAIISEVITGFNQRGNTTGNIVNGGYFAQQGDFVYYVSKGEDEFGSLYKMKLDGSSKEELSTDFASSINVIDDYIYYRDADEGAIQGNIFRIKTDGAQKYMISSDCGSSMNVIGDWIYYVNQVDFEDQKIYKIRVDGTEKTKICEDNADKLNVVGDWIYYRNLSDEFSLYKVRTNGTEKTKLDDAYISSIVVKDNWIYYTDGSLYKMKIDGTGKVEIADGAYELNVSGDYIYYTNHFMDGQNIFKVKNDGTGRVRLNSEKSWGISIVGSWIYYMGEDTTLKKISTDSVATDRVRKLELIGSTPKSGEVYNPDRENILANFSRNIDSVDRDKIIIKNTTTGKKLSTISWGYEDGQIVIRSSDFFNLPPQTPVTVTILKGAVTDIDGNTTTEDYTLNFTTPAPTNYKEISYTTFNDSNVSFNYPEFYIVSTAPEGAYTSLDGELFISKWGFFSKENNEYKEIQFEIRYDNHIEYGDDRAQEIITIDDVMNGLNANKNFAKAKKTKTENGIAFETNEDGYLTKYIYGNPIGDVIPKLSIGISASADKSALDVFNKLSVNMINSFKVLK